MATSNRGKKPSLGTQRILWAHSGGRCEHPGCAKDLLSMSGLDYSWDRINLGELAHNIASNPNGPRGDAARSHPLSDDPDNILMLCANCHTIADDLPDLYREDILRGWKQQHESRVRAAAKMTAGDIVLPIIVSATQIGGHPIKISDAPVIGALLEDNRIPIANVHRIVLDTQGQSDNTTHYWVAQINTVRDHLRLLNSRSGTEHLNAPLAIFPLAEMPLLIALGNALGDKFPVEIYQYARHSGSWTYQDPDATSPPFDCTLPETISDDGIALIVDLTAEVSDARVTAALPRDTIPLARFTTANKSTELVQSRDVIQAFQRAFRESLTQIENRSSRDAPIHLFPCVPAPLAVALGRCIMPKVSNPIIIYDAKGPSGAFHSCVTLPLPLTTENTLQSDPPSQGL